MHLKELTKKPSRRPFAKCSDPPDQDPADLAVSAYFSANGPVDEAHGV